MVTDESLKLLARRQPELLASTLRQRLGTNMTFDSDQGIQQILSQGITSCGRSNLWQEALEIFQLLKDQLEKPDVISYSALISSCRGQWQRTMQLFREMLQARNEADVISFSAVISSCEKSSQWTQALHVFGLMRDYRIPGNVISYSALISAAEKAGQWQLGLQLFSELDGDIKPDVISYSAAISACEKAGKWQLALLLFEDMPNSKIFPNIISLNAAIASCEKGNQWLLALHFLQCSCTRWTRWTLRPDVISYSSCLSACAQGQWRWALEVYGGMASLESLEMDVISCNAAISSCEKGTKWPAACYLLQDLTDVISYNSAVSSCRRASSPAWQVALRLFVEMSWKGIERNVLTHTEMVSTFMDSGQLKFGAGALNEIPLHRLLKQLAERRVHETNIRPHT